MSNSAIFQLIYNACHFIDGRNMSIHRKPLYITFYRIHVTKGDNQTNLTSEYCQVKFKMVNKGQ